MHASITQFELVTVSSASELTSNPVVGEAGCVPIRPGVSSADPPALKRRRLRSKQPEQRVRGGAANSESPKQLALTEKGKDGELENQREGDLTLTAVSVGPLVQEKPSSNDWRDTRHPPR